MLGVVPLQHERRIGAAEPEGIRQRRADIALLGLVRHQVKTDSDIAGVIQIQRRRADAGLDRQRGEDRFHRTGSTEQVTDGRLGRRHRQVAHRIAEQALHGAEFDLVTVDDYSAARLILAPGWRWSELVKPTELTEFCEHNHLGYCVSGSLQIQTSDGVRSTIQAHDTYALPPGHDEWVVGSEPFVAVEFLGAASYGRPRSRGMHALI